jgi:sec-independent protein translocase protein TatB
LFDVAFSELVVIAIVALIVIGPEKLPKVARALGVLAGRMQRYVATVKADINREMQFEDLQKLQQEIKQGVNQVQSEISRAQADINSEAEEIEHSIGGALTPPKKPDTLSDKPQ